MEPESQNHYPDFTLLKGRADREKIAIDVKTTYRKPNQTFWYTLGGYTSFIREGNERKNIVFPFTDYESHWIIGFVYYRVATKKSAAAHIFTVDDIGRIPLPLSNVEFFVQGKMEGVQRPGWEWQYHQHREYNGTIDDFRRGAGVFSSEAEFLAYWRGYGRTNLERRDVYRNIDEFRRLKD